MALLTLLALGTLISSSFEAIVSPQAPWDQQDAGCPHLTCTRGSGGGEGKAAVRFRHGRGGQNHSTSLR